jgi:hypothetical protein
LQVGVNGTGVDTIRAISTNTQRYNTDKCLCRQYTQPLEARLL